MATILTEEENTYLRSQLPSAPGAARSYWIGLTRNRTSGGWIWLTGDECLFANWAQGSADPKESKAMVAALADATGSPRQGRWLGYENDQNAYEEIAGFICEWEVAEDVGADAPAGAAVFGGHSYAFFKDRVTWFWAKARCDEMGGHLVTISSPEEGDFVASLLPRERDFESYYWIGLADESRKQSWTWITGEDCSYHHWRAGEPNNAGGNENYAAMTSSPTPALHGRWIDIEGPHRLHDIVLGFVCEWEAPGRRSARKPKPKASDTIVRFGAPVLFQEHQGHRYGLITEPLTWTQAKKKCEQLDGHLLTIDSKEEWEFVAARILPSLPREECYWIGLSNHEKKAEWRLITGARAQFLRWLPGEPNNFGGNENYGAIMASLDSRRHGNFNDLEGPDRVHDIVVGCICEIEK